MGTPSEDNLSSAKRRVKMEKENVSEYERRLNYAKDDLRKAVEDVAYWERIVELEQADGPQN